ncbi:MAG: hypothetical protein WCG47_22660 [Dermatophilaceae bacterium]
MDEILLLVVGHLDAVGLGQVTQPPGVVQQQVTSADQDRDRAQTA